MTALIITCCITFLIGFFLFRPAREERSTPTDVLRMNYEIERQLAMDKANWLNRMAEIQRESYDRNYKQQMQEFQDALAKAKADGMNDGEAFLFTNHLWPGMYLPPVECMVKYHVI